jgi:hypothetical protein
MGNLVVRQLAFLGAKHLVPKSNLFTLNEFLTFNVMKQIFAIISIIACLQLIGQSQQPITITGKVTDAQNGEPVSFANILVKGSNIGTNTNFEGIYSLQVNDGDSLVASFLGYYKKIKAIDKNKTVQTINVQLEPSTLDLSEVVIKPGENPAWAILRNVISNKERNDKKQLSSYQYQSYIRTEIDVDKISEQLKKSIITGRVASLLDNAQKIAGEDGKMLLPVFVSETVSDYYFNKNPSKTKEIIHKSRVSGVGVAENSLLNQLVGQSFLNFNFYNNYLQILSKDFVSPISDNWRYSYRYYLIDSLTVSDHFCYLIEFKPKNKLDLAFTGKMWIDKKSFALVQIDAAINKEANINYIEKIKIQQEFVETTNNAWLPINTRTLVDIAELSKNSSGLIAKSYIHNSNIIVDQPKLVSFFEIPIETADSTKADEIFWQQARPLPLTTEEKQVYQMIDSVKNLPLIKGWINTLDFIISGYKPIGKIELGPYLYTYAYNQFQGNCFRVGFRTNEKFSKSYFLKGYVAVSTKDPVPIKFLLDANRILSRKRYTEVGIRGGFEAEQLGISTEEISFNTNLSTSLFNTFSRFGKFNKPYYVTQLSAYFNTEITPGLMQNFTIRDRYFQTFFPFPFFVDLKTPDLIEIHDNYNTSEIIYELRYSRGEYAQLNKHNRRVTLRKNREHPTYSLKYTLSNKFLGSDFNYHKISASVSKSFRLGLFGRSRVTLYGAFTPSTLPYTLLSLHQGNQSPIYIGNAYNLMNYSEFVSDKYLSLHLYHDFEGLLFNRIPLIKKFNWRSHLLGKVLWGTLSINNQIFLSDLTLNGLKSDNPTFLNKEIPYAEIGYGIDNIFKCLRIDFLHRLTYCNQINVQNFAVKVSVSIKL